MKEQLQYAFENEDDQAYFQYAKGNAWTHARKNFDTGKSIVASIKEPFIVQDYDNYGNKIDLSVDNQFLFGMYLVQKMLLQEIIDSGSNGKAYADEIQESYTTQMQEGTEHIIPPSSSPHFNSQEDYGDVTDQQNPFSKKRRNE